jgi:putative transposase
MPTHFHFLIQVKSEQSNLIKNNIGILLSSYTKAINKSYIRTGSLFQNHTKAKLIEDDNYLWNLINYIHQNPLRKGLVKKIDEWEFSSYRDLAGLRNGTLVDKSLFKDKFKSKSDFVFFSSIRIEKFDYMFGDKDMESTS